MLGQEWWVIQPLVGDHTNKWVCLKLKQLESVPIHFKPKNLQFWVFFGDLFMTWSG